MYPSYKSINQQSPLTSPVVDGPIDHVVFVIHGIGQQTERFGFFQKHLQSLFDTTNEAVETSRPGSHVNIQYIPIEWHMHIHKETDAVMDQITPRSIPALRLLNNDYLADAFFYLANDRCQSIIHHVTQSFNKSYAEFKATHPEFKGKVAILAYSLGGIITWDILSNQEHSKKKNSKLNLDFPKLDFKPDYLFNLGSPLSAFLIVRNQDPKLYHPDPSIRFENIFHPFDPLGYRFEPLMTSASKDTPAVLVDRCLSSSFDQITHHSIWNAGRHLINSLLKGDCPKEDPEECRKRARVCSFSSEPAPKKLCQDQTLLNTTLTRSSELEQFQSLGLGAKRIDYVLQPEKFLGFLTKNPYLSGLTAHFSYWTHKDLLWHIVRRLEN